MIAKWIKVRIKPEMRQKFLDAIEVDALEFEQLIDDGSPTALEQAAALYRGDLLDGIEAHDPCFESWLRDERQRLRERACEALSRLLGMDNILLRR